MNSFPGHCEGVVCDVHLRNMRPVRVTQSMGMLTKTLEGFACSVAGCTRFFGTEGYSDLTKDSEFANVRTEPCCSKQHASERMYIQQKAGDFQWVCRICNAAVSHHLA